MKSFPFPFEKRVLESKGAAALSTLGTPPLASLDHLSQPEKREAARSIPTTERERVRVNPLDSRKPFDCRPMSAFPFPPPGEGTKRRGIAMIAVHEKRVSFKKRVFFNPPIRRQPGLRDHTPSLPGRT